MAYPVTILILCFISPIFMDERGDRVKRIVGGNPADPPPEDDPTVYTNFAGKAARVQGVREFPHYVFRGIKYALPPIGKNRFLRPKQKFLEGHVDATRYAPPCIQPRPGTNMIIGSEDCLAVNVFTPELPTGLEGLPVVVWIHGGGFRYGSASQYGVRHLVGKQLVVVTIQYRLGSLGFLSDGSKQLPGNVALWDMVLAVQWVRNYIGFFGGNPYRIVVMGHDTGASSALLVTLSKVAKGLSAGVIAMSGTAVSRWAVDNSPQTAAKDIADQNGCPIGDIVTMVKCLQTLPPESIIKGDSYIEFHRLQSNGFMSGLSGNLGGSPVTEGVNDGRSLPGLVENEPINDLEKENNPKIPLLTGIVKDETKRAVKGYMNEDIIKKLKTVPNYIENVLVNNLKGFIPLKNHLQEVKQNAENLITGLIPLNFKNYLQHNKDNLFESLEKISDITNDVLFNVPAFLTVDRWSRNGAPTFLYSFEHFGKLKKGNTFLRGSPLVGNDTETHDDNGTVGHGDDLAYLFDANDVEGKSLNSDVILNEDDRKVRDFFTQMISDFARHGAPRMNNKNILPFSGKTNNFIQIKPKPEITNNFKFCEMALWCNIAERLKSTSCQFLDALNTSLKNIENLAGGFLNNTVFNGNKIWSGMVNKSSAHHFSNIFGGGNKIALPTYGSGNTTGIVSSSNTSHINHSIGSGNKINNNENYIDEDHNKQPGNLSIKNISDAGHAILGGGNEILPQTSGLSLLASNKQNKAVTNVPKAPSSKINSIDDSISKVFNKPAPPANILDQLGGVNNIFGSAGRNKQQTNKKPGLNLGGLWG
ncbi:unnamed protein product [Phaedon cochleariae]|uniref:Carboxylesterase type B domain-containing protein n=1 Tax=Phaedon cochleariae TaxID=80249 RepID=A0A9N9WXB9_PHACE|nr:unnamed protein product [Phaedon cochleariae]